MELPNAGTPSRKTVVLALAGFFVIVLFILISIFSGSSGKQQVSKQAVVESPDKVNSSIPSVSPPAPSEIVDDWQAYQNSQYSIKYPKDWQTEELIYTGGARGLGIKPTVLTNFEKANITLSVNDAESINNIRKSDSMYAQLGFKRSSIKINNLIAIKLSGSIPKKTASLSPTAKALQTGYVILEQGGSRYLFDYSYINPEVDVELEAIFEKIMISFKSVQ